MKPTETIEESVLSLMRKMDPNMKLVIPIEMWNSARDYAWRIKRDFGVKFRIRRMKTSKTKKNLILVERID